MDKVDDNFFSDSESIYLLSEVFPILDSIYSAWVKVFPFELECFKELQAKYTKNIPVFKNDGFAEYNKEENSYTAIVYRVDEFIEVLNIQTLDITQTINHLMLKKQGLLTDVNKRILELADSERQHELYEQRIKHLGIEKPTYIDILSDWYKSELKYIERIKPLLEINNTKNLHAISKESLSVSEWAIVFYYAEASGFYNSDTKLSEKISRFILDNNLDVSSKSFSNKYYKVKTLINKTYNFTSTKYKKIIPFLKKYKGARQRAENDMDISDNEQKYLE